MLQTFSGTTHLTPFAALFVGTVSVHVRVPPPASAHVPAWQAFTSSRHAAPIFLHVQSGLQQPLPSTLGVHCGLVQSALASRGVTATLAIKKLRMNSGRSAGRTTSRYIMGEPSLIFGRAPARRVKSAETGRGRRRLA